MAKRVILGIQVTDRLRNAIEVQRVFTEHGCNIKTRLGLHDVSETKCGPTGLVILELFGDDAALGEMESKLRKIEGLAIQKMVFEEH